MFVEIHLFCIIVGLNNIYLYSFGVFLLLQLISNDGKTSVSYKSRRYGIACTSILKKYLLQWITLKNETNLCMLTNKDKWFIFTDDDNQKSIG
jgi:hypothetical protein